MSRVLVILLILTGCPKRATVDSSSTEETGADLCPKPDMFGPLQLPEDVYEARTMPRATRFSDRITSKEAPFEVCLVAGQLELLLSLTCDEGSFPFDGDRNAAHAARTSSVGPGGRCGEIIDAYAVTCPEQTYTVFIDMYHCPEGTSF